MVTGQTKTNDMASVSCNHPAINIDAQFALGEIIDNDNQRKGKILEICTQIKKILEKDEGLRDILTKEFGIEILDLNHIHKEIYDSECPIVVAGEVSAGKSSLINLLLGKSILPVRQLASTSTICRLRNSEDRRIVLTDNDNKRTTETFSDEEGEMEKFLEEHVGRRSNPNPYKYVDISLPIPILQEHAIIVDTPGVGKKKTGRLFEYLPNAIAFIYVINAGNASGVENDDWLQQIIVHLIEQQQKGHLHDFKPETTMFVCNKWDQVQPNEQDEVFQFIVDKLKSDWPNFDENLQIFKLSAVQEKERMEKGSSTSANYNNFVNGITTLISITLDTKVVRHARKQTFLIEKMADRILEKISTSQKSMIEKERRRTDAEYRLQQLDSKHLNEIKENAIKKLEFKCEEISQRIVNHLKSLTHKDIEWEYDALPDDEQDFLVLRKKAKDLILEKVYREINNWRLKNKDSVDDEIKQVLRKEFKIIEESLQTIPHFARSLTTYTPSDSLLDNLSRYIGIGNILPIPASLFASFVIPGIILPIGAGISSWLLYRYVYNNKRLEKYRANKRQCMVEWTSDVLQNGINEKKVYELMQPFVDHHKTFISTICNLMVPQILEAEKFFIEDALNDSRSVIELSDKYVPLLRDCQILLGNLDLIFLEYFKNSELASLYVHNVMIISTISAGNSSDVHQARCQLGNRENQVAIQTFKMPLKESENFNQLSYIYSLRKLQVHPNIIQLIGLSFKKDNEKRFLQIIMELCEESLYSIVYRKRTPIPCGSIQHLKDCKDSWKFVTNIIEGICAGLDHIHNKGFVHRDLRIENIMINANGQVKLVKFGLIKDGIKESLVEVTRKEVNMAPEVLSGDLTSKEADVYSVGMIIYELWYYHPGFSQPLPHDPTEYEFIINTIDELKTLVLEKGNKKKSRPNLKEGFRPPTELQNILMKCWDAKKENRPAPYIVFNLVSGVQMNKTGTQTEQ